MRKGGCAVDTATDGRPEQVAESSLDSSLSIGVIASGVDDADGDIASRVLEHLKATRSDDLAETANRLFGADPAAILGYEEVPGPPEDARHDRQAATARTIARLEDPHDVAGAVADHGHGVALQTRHNDLGELTGSRRPTVTDEFDDHGLATDMPAPALTLEGDGPDLLKAVALHDGRAERSLDQLALPGERDFSGEGDGPQGRVAHFISGDPLGELSQRRRVGADPGRIELHPLPLPPPNLSFGGGAEFEHVQLPFLRQGVAQRAENLLAPRRQARRRIDRPEVKLAIADLKAVPRMAAEAMGLVAGLAQAVPIEADRLVGAAVSVAEERGGRAAGFHLLVVKPQRLARKEGKLVKSAGPMGRIERAILDGVGKQRTQRAALSLHMAIRRPPLRFVELPSEFQRRPRHDSLVQAHERPRERSPSRAIDGAQRPVAWKDGCSEAHAYQSAVWRKLPDARRPTHTIGYTGERMAIRSKTQRSLLLGFIGSICLCGLIGVFCLLQGRLGDFEGRVLLTTAVVGAGAILALASAVAWEQRRWHPLGALGMAAVALTTLFTLACIWTEPRYNDWVWKVLAISWVFAVGLPHVGLLSLARLKNQWKSVLGICVALIGLLAWLIIVSILAEISSEDWYRGVAIVAIGVVCGTITVPILHRVSRIQIRESVKTTELALSLTCPRCSKTQTVSVGRSKCAECGLKFQIEIEEENCVKCGYPLYKLESAACPECGTPIARPALGTLRPAPVPNSA